MLQLPPVCAESAQRPRPTLLLPFSLCLPLLFGAQLASRGADCLPWGQSSTGSRNIERLLPDPQAGVATWLVFRVWSTGVWVCGQSAQGLEGRNEAARTAHSSWGKDAAPFRFVSGPLVFLALEAVVAVLLLTFLSSVVTLLLVSKSCLHVGEGSTFSLIAVANGFP